MMMLMMFDMMLIVMCCKVGAGMQNSFVTHTINSLGKNNVILKQTNISLKPEHDFNYQPFSTGKTFTASAVAFCGINYRNSRFHIRGPFQEKLHNKRVFAFANHSSYSAWVTTSIIPFSSNSAHYHTHLIATYLILKSGFPVISFISLVVYFWGKPKRGRHQELHPSLI